MSTYFFCRCTLNVEICAVHSATKALFLILIKSFKFTLKYTIISLIHVSVFNDRHQGALSYLTKVIVMLKHSVKLRR